MNPEKVQYFVDPRSKEKRDKEITILCYRYYYRFDNKIIFFCIFPTGFGRSRARYRRPTPVVGADEQTRARVRKLHVRYDNVLHIPDDRRGRSDRVRADRVGRDVGKNGPLRGAGVGRGSVRLQRGVPLHLLRLRSQSYQKCRCVDIIIIL